MDRSIRIPVKDSHSRAFSAEGMAAIALLALTFGGATELWAQTLIAGLMALLIFLAPPRQSSGKFPSLVFALLLGLALAAFLPERWFALPEWRRQLVEDFGVPLGVFRTPQRWLTAQACGLFFVGLLWSYYALSQRWDDRAKLRAARVLVIGVAVLATISIIAFLTGFRVPLWHHAENRGWFPNRNQTANVLALCGVVNYALVFEGLRKNPRAGFLWMLSLAPICAGLVVSYSRAGILLFFCGLFLWHFLLLRKRGGSAKRAALGLTALAGFLTLFLLFGGETLARFQHFPAGQNLREADFRVLVHRDAFKFSLAAPWLGIGLGNFDALFERAREISIMQVRTIHPESDWFWTACELGWLAPVLLVSVFGWWLRKCLRVRTNGSGVGETLSLAAMVSVILFALHGVVDVSGHRLGSALVAMLMAGLALPAADQTKRAYLTPWIFRALSVAVAAVAVWWLASLRGANVPPTSATLDRLATETAAADEKQDYSSVAALSTDALKIAPLDWQLYFQRAAARLVIGDSAERILRDFQIARALQPHWATMCFNEGKLWLAANEPELCMNAWTEGLRRAGPDALSFYKQMLDLSAASVPVRDALRELAQTDAAHLLVFLESAMPAEANTEIANFLISDPDLQTLSAAERERLFAVWWQRGDRSDLGEKLIAHEDWQSAGWKYLADYFAEEKNYQRACETVFHFAQAPSMPELRASEPRADLEREFYFHPDDFIKGFALYAAEIKEGRKDEALATIRDLKKIKNHPLYLSYLEAKLHADAQQWEPAWSAWREFATTPR